jgi:hypothetical protein
MQNQIILFKGEVYFVDIYNLTIFFIRMRHEVWKFVVHLQIVNC